MKRIEQADRALVRGTTISNAQRFGGPKDVTAPVRKRSRAARVRASRSVPLRMEAAASRSQDPTLVPAILVLAGGRFRG